MVFNLVATFSNGALSEQAFYAQKTFGERVTDNVAGWLELPHVSMFDVCPE
jgi:hypothetical protein